MTARQPSWDKYEAVILLEGLLASMKGELTRSDAIKSVSRDLRKRALCRGIEIDEQYRNENGISFQMNSMESAYHGHTIFKPATRLFAEVATIYHKSSDEYQKLLKEAKAVIDRKNTVEEDFMNYLADKVSPAQLSELYQCYSEIEAFGLKVKVLKKALFQTTDFEIIKKLQRTIEQNKIFRITHKKQFNKLIAAGRHYYNYIKEGLYPQISDMVVDATKHPIETHRPVEETTAVVAVTENTADVPLTRSEQDERLLQKYPIIYKRLFNALKNAFAESTSGVPIGKMGEKTGHIARPSVIEEILDNVSWAMAVGEDYVFSIEVVDHCVVINESDDEIVESASSDYTICEINFNGCFDLSYTRPEGFSYFGEKKDCGNSWTSLYINFMVAVIDDYPHIFKSGMSFSKNGGRIELANHADYSFMVAPKPVPGTDYVLETNISASDIANKIRYILDLCNLDYENIVITYSKKTARSRPAESETDNRPALTLESKAVNSSTFSQYMENTLKMAASTCRSYSSAINNCEAFAREHHLSSWRLYTEDKNEAKETARLLLSDADFLNYNKRQHNRFRAALQKFLAFIESDLPQTTSVEQVPESITAYRNEAYEEVLKHYFKKGFRMESPLEIRKFRRYYTVTHNAELSDSDADIGKNIRLLTIAYDGKAFLPEVMLSDELKERLLKYIEDAFADGKTAIYYQAIYTEFAEAFLDYHIHDADMLKSYLTLVGSGRFFINRSFVSKEPNIVLDTPSEVRSCLQGYGRPMEYEELFVALPHLPQSKVKFILASNGEFVNNGRGAYFHESIVHLSDEELEGIADIIRQTIEDKNFIGGNELYDAIKAKYPYIIEDNHNLSMYGFRDALKAKLGNRFSFKGNIISRSGQELSMTEVFAKYARTHDSFTLSELQGLANNLATVIYFDPVYENSLRISRDQFVSKETAQFSVPDTDEAIDNVCTGKYIPLKEVTNFGIFPYAGFPWNSFLLEHYVANYSHKYMLIHSSFNSTEYAGAIVKRSAGIQSFDDLIVDLLVNNSVEMKKAPVLQFLSDKGYLSRRRYAGIEPLIIKANAKRQGKDKE